MNIPPSGWKETRMDPIAAPVQRPERTASSVYEILLVEDDAWMADFVTTLFDRFSDIRVLRMKNGLEAHRHLMAAKVDLIITDILMPEMDGIELIQKRAGLAPDTPVIAFSGGGFRLDQEDLLKYAHTFGANVVLNKPVAPRRLIDEVRALLPERRA